MPKKLTTEEFVKRSQEKHGDKYNYSKTIYINKDTPVCIICPIHGEFWQRPASHLSGIGCRKCSYLSSQKKNTKTTTVYESLTPHWYQR